MVHPFQDKAIGIEDIAWVLEREYLAPPIPEVSITTYNSVEEQLRYPRPLAGADDILTGRILSCLSEALHKGILLFDGQIEDAVHLFKQPVCVVCLHGNLLPKSIPTLGL
jgi:hypothetical protein